MDLISYCAVRAAKVVWQPGHGGFAFTVVCKATFELRPALSPFAPKQEPIVEADVSPNPGASLSLASDLVPFKTRPEVLVSGHAYAPEGRPVPSLVARVAVGDMDKAIQVVGDRSFGKDGRLRDPSPFTRMPLVWERAAGGPGTSNPVGRLSGAAARPELSGDLPAPNLLPSGLRLVSRADVVPPVGFGPVAPLWPSRAACLHRHAAFWDPNRWSERPLPTDIDFGYFNAAPQDQQRSIPFGEDVIHLENLHPRFSRLSTRLAPVALTATVDQGAGAQPLKLRCDTMIIDTDRGLAMLVWRAHVLLDRADRPGRVAILGPTAPEVMLGDWARNLSDAKATALPSRAPLSAPLPFAESAGPPPRAPAPAPVPSPEAAGLPPRVSDWARNLSDAKATAPPSRAPAPAPLPFTGAAGSPPRAPSSTPLPFSDDAGLPPHAIEWARKSSDPQATTPPPSAPSSAPLPFSDDAGLPPHAIEWARSLTDAKATAVLGNWARNLSDPKATAPPMRAPASAPLPFSEPARPAPPLIVAPLEGTNTGALRQPEPPPMPVQDSGAPALDAGPPVTSSSIVSPAVPPAAPPAAPPAVPPAAPPAETSDQARIRLIQQAIWKGDRPTQEILAEHGLTELSWRAMKRASAKKPGS